MEDVDWTGVIFGFGSMVLAAVIIVVILLLAGSFARARVTRHAQGREQALIDRYEQLSAETTKAQENVAGELSDLRTRLAEIERMMREVE